MIVIYKNAVNKFWINPIDKLICFVLNKKIDIKYDITIILTLNMECLKELRNITENNYPDDKDLANVLDMIERITINYLMA